MKQLAKFAPSRGLASDLPPFSVGRDFFTSAANIVFRPFAERAGGYAAVYATPQVEVRSLLNAPIAGVNYWLYNGKNKSYAAVGAVHTDITKAAGTLTTVTKPNQWSVGLFNGLPFANNGVDAPMSWDGNTANDMVVLTGWPVGSSCYTLRAFRNFLIAMNISTAGGNFPDQVKWSNLAVAGAMPTSWTAAATNEAGDAQASDTPGGLIDGAPLGAGFALYKARAAYLLEYTKGEFVFSLRPLPIGRGVLTRNCIADFRGRHFLLTDGDMILTDGVSVESVAQNRMQRFVFSQLDQASFESCFVIAFPKRNEIACCFPSAGNTFCDLAAIWNSSDNTWGVRELPLVSCGATGIVSDTAPSDAWDADAGTWDSDATLWNELNYSSAEEQLVLGKPNDAAPTSSLILQMDSGLTANGAAINARVSKYGMDLGDPSRVKLVTRVYLYVNANPGTQLLCRVGSQMDPSGPITWSAQVTYTVGSSAWVDTYSSGRFHSIEVQSTAAASWSLPAFDLEYRPRGYF